MNEFSSKFPIETIEFNTKLTFSELAKENITSQQLYIWSAPIDLIEDYQFYLNQLSNENNSSSANGIFYNCTWPRFGRKCQYEFYSSPISYSSTYTTIHNFYTTFPYEPIILTCYQHLECNHRIFSACLDWSEICNGKIDCLNNGIDEEHCWQLDINQCEDDEHRCYNGQCIFKTFHQDDNASPECLDRSDDGLPLLKYFAGYNCRSSEPSFICENTICAETASPRHCIFMRRSMLLEEISWNTTNSTSEECWSASKCLLRYTRFVRQFSDYVKEFCENLCATNACVAIVAKSCPDILDIPDQYFSFGHLRLIYKKIIEQNLTTEHLWQFYICYSKSYYDAFFQMFPKIILNNKTCFFYETVSRSTSGLETYLTNHTFLQNLHDQFQRYHLIYNYNSTICNRSNMYQCLNSSKCISIYRLLDKIQDCPYIDDEDMILINDSHVIKQLDKTHFKCHTTNTYIHRSFVNNVECDCPHDEYYQCEDEDRYNSLLMFDPFRNISFQTICDGFVELLSDEHNQTDETECQQWPCDNIYTHCNNVWNCLNGIDEINCHHSSTLLKCPLNHHQCVSSNTTQLICLPIDKFNDGHIDCLGGTDEIIRCRKTYATIQSENFYCTINDVNICIARRYLCDGQNKCEYRDDEKFCEKNRTLSSYSGVCSQDNLLLQSDVEKFLCNQAESYVKENIVYFKLDEIKNTKKVVLSRSSVNVQTPTVQYKSYCQRGLHLHVWLNNISRNDTCLCPPSYYGSQCQYQNQRISLTMKFQALSDSYRTLFTIIISLMEYTNDRIIHSYEQITYLSYVHCMNKFNMNLYYLTRRKNLTKQYYIHIDFYEKVSLVYRGSVLFPVLFPFLPVQRLSFVARIPSANEENDKPLNSLSCVRGKSIRYTNNPAIPSFCQCDSGWSGKYCTVKSSDCNCAPDSKCLGVTGNNRSICICRIHKFGSRCLLTKEICQNNSICENGGQCIPSDDYFLSKQSFVCLCPAGFRGDRCEIPGTKLILSFDKNIRFSSSVFIHFIEILEDRFPIKSTTVRTISFEQKSLIVYWSKSFHLVFLRFNDDKNYYITVKQTIYNESMTINKTIHASDRCPYIREVLNATIVQWDPIRAIKYYHQPCQNLSLNLSCFYDDAQLCLCYNFHEQRLANCFNFTHNVTIECSGQSVCQNGGTCLQDDRDCPTRSICVCPSCFFGTRCQLTASGFGLSLDAILGYHILPKVDFTNQTLVVKISLTMTTIFIIVGVIDSIASMMIFKNRIVREVGCGLYLLASSITTLLLMVMFGLKFFILLFAHMSVITDRSFLFVQCYSIDFLLRIGLYIDQWLNACVAIERAYTMIKGTSFNKKKSKQTAKFVISLLAIMITVSTIHDPISRNLMDEEANDDDQNVKRTWCITKYGSSLQVYDSILSTFHLFGPFLINLSSAVILITKRSRQQVNAQNKRLYKEILIGELKKNKHLLIAPIVLVILAIPRLLITFISKCLQSSNDVWLYLFAYFISFIPSILTFMIFIFPSKFYKKEFRKTVNRFGRMIQRRLYLPSSI